MNRAPRVATDVVSGAFAALFAGLFAAGFAATCTGFAATCTGLPVDALAGFPAGVVDGALPGFAVAAIATVVTAADFLLAGAVDDPVLTALNAGAGTAFVDVGFAAIVGDAIDFVATTGLAAGFTATVAGVTGFVATVAGVTGFVATVVVGVGFEATGGGATGLA